MDQRIAKYIREHGRVLYTLVYGMQLNNIKEKRNIHSKIVIYVYKLTVDSFGAKGSEHLQLHLRNNTGFKYMFKRILLSIQILDSVYEPIYTVKNMYND